MDAVAMQQDKEKKERATTRSERAAKRSDEQLQLEEQIAAYKKILAHRTDPDPDLESRMEHCIRQCRCLQPLEQRKKDITSSIERLR